MFHVWACVIEFRADVLREIEFDLYTTYMRDRSITHSLQNMRFDKILDLTAGSYFQFYNISTIFDFFS